MKNLFLPEIDFNAPAEFNLKTYKRWDLKSDSLIDYYSIDNCFDEKECFQIIKLGRSLVISESSTMDGQSFSEIRKSKNSWIPPCELSNWIYNRINEKINIANTIFDFDLLSIENLQFTEYDDRYSGYYGAHVDKFIESISSGSHRKLSFSIQLTDSNRYEGGDLLLYNSKDPIKANKNLGSINFFPSYVLHEVTPVTRGKRYSLVSWISGPKFR